MRGLSRRQPLQRIVRRAAKIVAKRAKYTQTCRGRHPGVPRTTLYRFASNGIHNKHFIRGTPLLPPAPHRGKVLPCRGEFVCLRFGYIPIRAMNGVVAGVIVPIRSLSDSIPLCLGALVIDRCQPATAIERNVSDRCHALGYSDRG